MVKLRIDEQIKIVCVKSGLSISEIGRRLNKSPQAFSQKIKRGNMTLDDLEDIALVSGCKLECKFVYSNGDTITIK